MKMVNVNAMLVFAVIVGEQDTSKRQMQCWCLLSLLESKTQVKGKCNVGEVKLEKIPGKKKCIFVN